MYKELSTGDHTHCKALAITSAVLAGAVVMTAFLVGQLTGDVLWSGIDEPARIAVRDTAPVSTPTETTQTWAADQSAQGTPPDAAH